MPFRANITPPKINVYYNGGVISRHGTAVVVQGGVRPSEKLRPKRQNNRELPRVLRTKPFPAARKRWPPKQERRRDIHWDLQPTGKARIGIVLGRDISDPFRVNPPAHSGTYLVQYRLTLRCSVCIDFINTRIYSTL